MLLNLLIQKGRIEMPEKRDDITKAIELLNKNGYSCSQFSELNIHQKLQHARYEISKKEIKKTGKCVAIDGTVRYEYFELNDFMPYVIEVCFKYGLSTKFDFGLEVATLIITNCDNPEDTIDPFKMPVKVPEIMMCNEMQNIGGAKTFAKRYLYSDAFEISQTDIIDSSEPNEEEAEGIKKISKAAVFTIRRLLEETETDEEKFLKWVHVSSIEDIKNKNLGIVMKKLNEKKEEIDEKKTEQIVIQKNENEFPDELKL
ncbi:recombinase [Clostridium butyricum]|uniref:ERF superfamily protein n=2 Tax=Clostridium butyricum TaxID=1492 RepID=A0A6N3BRA9_CLOBU